MGGCCLDSTVRERIGYPGQKSIPNETPYALLSYALDGSPQRVCDWATTDRPRQNGDRSSSADREAGVKIAAILRNAPDPLVELPVIDRALSRSCGPEIS